MCTCTHMYISGVLPHSFPPTPSILSTPPILPSPPFPVSPQSIAPPQIATSILLPGAQLRLLPHKEALPFTLGLEAGPCHLSDMVTAS